MRLFFEKKSIRSKPLYFERSSWLGKSVLRAKSSFFGNLRLFSEGINFRFWFFKTLGFLMFPVRKKTVFDSYGYPFEYFWLSEYDIILTIVLLCVYVSPFFGTMRLFWKKWNFLNIYVFQMFPVHNKLFSNRKDSPSASGIFGLRFCETHCSF